MKQTKARILVVEDDPALLTGLLDVLVFNGYDVKGVADGEQGLNAGREEYYDLLLLDVMLPTMDGFTICKHLRKKKPNQAIIMITAKAPPPLGNFHPVFFLGSMGAGQNRLILPGNSLRSFVVRHQIGWLSIYPGP